MEKRIEISYKFKFDKIQAMKDRNRQLEEDIDALIRRRNKDKELIDTTRKEILDNLDRINKLQKRFGVDEERQKFRTQFHDKE